MNIVEIFVPGEALRQAREPHARAVESLLYELEVRFFEAHAALNLFEEARDQMAARPHAGLSDADTQRRHDIIAELTRERGLLQSAETAEAIRTEANIRFKREKWAQGKEPGEFAQRRVFIAAQAFLSAVDGFEQLLGALAQTPSLLDLGLRAQLLSLHEHLRDSFASLRSAPPSDRPVAERDPHAGPAAALRLSRSLRGNRYGCVMPDGHFAQVEVSGESLEALRAIFQSTLEAFDWDGLPRHLPLM